MSQPICSVIVPSYNRRASLEMVLEGLAKQTLPAEQFEVLVVLDGSTDDSAEMLAAWERSGRIQNLRWHIQPNSGQATARNTGASLASAPIVVFLDDDIVPEPDLLAVHMGWHTDDQPLAVLGDCHIVCEQDDSLYHRSTWAWWEDLYHHRALAGRKPGCRDFCAGNVSLRKQDFLRVGGFDTEFRGYGGEDYELGYRLLEAGVRFVADRSAEALHYHRTQVAGILRATRQEAHGDVIISRKHPELMAGLRVMHNPTGLYKRFAQLAMEMPRIGDPIAAACVKGLRLLERMRLYARWQTVFHYLRVYMYWRGLHDIFGTRQALEEFRAKAPAIPEHTVDIADGLPKDLGPLWVEGPSRLHITYRGERIGTLPISKPIEVPLHHYLAEQILNYFAHNIWLARLQSQDGTIKKPDAISAETTFRELPVA